MSDFGGEALTADDLSACKPVVRRLGLERREAAVWRRRGDVPRTNNAAERATGGSKIVGLREKARREGKSG